MTKVAVVGQRKILVVKEGEPTPTAGLPAGTTKGDRGEPGPQGPKGDPGPPGPKGNPGSAADAVSKDYVDHQILELANTVAARVKALATGVSVLGLLNDPPANPSPGTYLIDEHPTGIWATRPGDIGIWDGEHWTYYHHPTGDVVIFEVANGNAYRWDGMKYVLDAHVARVTAGNRFPDVPEEKDLHWLLPEKVLYIYDQGRWDPSSPKIQVPTGATQSAPIEVLGVRDRPPADAVDGDTYIVADHPFANGWHGMDRWIATKQSTSSLGWDFRSPGRPGTRYHVKDIDAVVVWDGITWQNSYTAPTIFVTDEPISDRVVGDIKFVSIPEHHIEMWNGARWTRVTHGLYYQNIPPEAPAHDVHDNDLWFDPDTRRFGVASGGHWHQTDMVLPQQVGGDTWVGNHLAAGHGSIWWKQELNHFEPWIYNGKDWVPAYPPASATYTPKSAVTQLHYSSFVQEDSTQVIPLAPGQVGRIFVDLNTSVVHRPKIIAYSHDNQTKELPGFSFVNDEILGSGTGDGTQWHAPSVRFGSAVPHVDGTQMRVENADNLSNRNTEPSNQLQLSYVLEYYFSRNDNGDDILRFELVGTAGTETTASKALPIRVHANFVYPADLTGFKLLNEEGKFVSQILHTVLGV